MKKKKEKKTGIKAECRVLSLRSSNEMPLCTRPHIDSRTPERGAGSCLEKGGKGGKGSFFEKRSFFL
jgi:hypothetical protein